MSKEFKEAKEIINDLSKLPHKDLFMKFMEYAYDSGYGNKIVELFNNYLIKENR